MAQQFDRDDGEVLAQSIQVGFERGGTGREPVEQDEGRRILGMRIDFVSDALARCAEERHRATVGGAGERRKTMCRSRTGTLTLQCVLLPISSEWRAGVRRFVRAGAPQPPQVLSVVGAHRGGRYDGRTMEIDYAILADYAEVVSSKLYLMGGGWDSMGAVEAPAAVRLAIATGVRVEWEETNVPIPVLITIDDDDAQEIMRLEAQMNVGRPPTLPAGSTQLSQMTAAIQVSLPRFGGYRVTVIAGTGDAAVRRTLPFRLVRHQRPG